MSSNREVINFIYDLRIRKICIWLQDLIIRVFHPSDVVLTENEKQFIKDNKPQIILLLKENSIYSKMDSNKILKCNFKEAYPLSFSQERLWFLEQFEQGSYIYHIPRIYRLTPSANLDILKKSFDCVVSRHEILRSFIKTDSCGVGYQTPDPFFKSVPINISTVSSREELDCLINKNINDVFDLENEYPIKVTCYQLINKNTARTQLYISIIMHHIAADGWSMEIFGRELYECYLSLLTSSFPELPELEVQYKDYAEWQRKFIAAASISEQLNFWRVTLNDYEMLSLPQASNRPEHVDYCGENIYFELDSITSKHLRTVAHQLNLSLYTLLLGGYVVLLHYLTNQNDIIIGTVTANRSHEQIEKLIGFFVNTLPLRVKINPKETLVDFIQRLKSDVLNAQSNQDVPFEKLIDNLNLLPDTSRHPLFQVMFVAHGFESNASCNIHKILEPYSYQVDGISAKFDLTTTWNESDEQLKCNFNYKTSLFNQVTVEKFVDLYRRILELIVDSFLFDIVTTHTIQHLIENVHDDVSLPHEEVDFPSDQTLFSLFDKQALLTPDAIAITDIKRKADFSYAKLALDANKMASYLFDIGKTYQSQLIGVLSEKGYNHAVATLSIMKSGHAYLPLHHDWPTNRIREVLAKGNVSILLVSKTYFLTNNISVELGYLKTIIIEDLLDELCCNKGMLITLPSIHSNDMAYVIFTSGSTGKPKGVTISHRGAINTIYAVNQKFGVSSRDVVLALSELSFDLSVYDIFGLLAVGGRVVFPDSELITEPAHWIELIDDYKISIWNSVPQLAALLVDEAEFMSKNLRLFLLSGDWIPLKLPEVILQKYQHARIISLGGATEGSIWSIWYEIQKIDAGWNSIPYGLAMPNQVMLILNDCNNYCPPGVIGEIYIGGEGVALNYWGDLEGTNNSFIENAQYGRIYKTGDLGRWNASELIEFMGRKDTQIKLNGYRIELDEISIHLSKLNGITDAASLVVKHNGQDHICSYYVGIKKEEASLLEELRKLLPEYMVPSILIHLECMPLTSNGKIDRKRLPNPDFSLNQNNFTPPLHPVEAQICDIFANILSVGDKKIGIDDDFFRLGGDSISSIRLVSSLKKELGLSVTAKDIFSYRTVSRLYKHLMSAPNKKQKGQNDIAEQGVLTGPLDLLPIQRWFFVNKFANLNHFNHSFLIKVPHLNVAILQKSIYKLIEYHDILRLRFKSPTKNNTAYQPSYSCSQDDIQLQTTDLKALEKTNETLAELLTTWQCGFDIVEGPLCSFGYISGYEDGSARIHIAIHHLLIDTVSWRNLTSDLKLIYQSLEKGEQIELPIKGTSYRQWVELIKYYPFDNQSERFYWERILTDYKRQPSFKPLNHLSYTTTYLDEKTTQVLLSQIHSVLNTKINDVLLTALAYALADINGNRVNYITLEGHGREDIGKQVDITNTVGWFTTMYPVRLEINPASRMIANIKLIKENLRNIPNNGIGYGALMGYEEHKLPDITFNYLGQFEHQRNSQTWCVIDEASGKSNSDVNHEPNIISISAAVMGGKFEIAFKCQLTQNKTDFLSNQYIHHLERLIHSLVPIDFQEYTMSDYVNYEPHVVIDNGKPQTLPMFIFPPGIGGYECYLNNIVPALNLHLVLFNNFNAYLREIWDADRLSHLSFESLAETYIAHIKTLQPTGPYTLFGWSFGGVLAFEIAKQLIQAGDRVSHLFMVDAYFKVKDVFKNLKNHSHAIETVGHLNYKYDPDGSFLGDLNMTLFKATEIHSGENSELFNYYAKNEKYNGLDKILSKNRLHLHSIQASHFSWINCKNVINQMADIIKSSIGEPN